MADKTWTFELAEHRPSGEAEYPFASFRPATHRVDLHHNYWTAKRTVHLDGVLLPPDQIRSYAIFGYQSDDLFVVDGHACVVRIRSNGVAYKYDLAVDGVSVQTRQPVDIPPEVFQAQPGAKEGMPGWAWLFVVLCPIVGLGSIFAGIGLAYLLTRGTPPSRNARFVHLLATPVIIQALYAIVRASKDPARDTKSRVIQSGIILGRMALIVTALVALAFTLIH